MMNFWVLGYAEEEANYAFTWASISAVAGQSSQVTQPSQQATSADPDPKWVKTPVSQLHNSITQASDNSSTILAIISIALVTNALKAIVLKLAKNDAP